MSDKPEPMMIGGVVRYPRALVFGNGKPLAALEEFEVENNSYYQADSFRVVLSLWGRPKETDLEFWSAQKKIVVEVYAGFPKDPDNFTKSDLDNLITGETDDIEILMAQGKVILTGRDYTNRFIDSQTSEKFQNETASEIVEKIAKRHGLDAKVKKTTVKAGSYYANEKASLTKRQSEWDLITWLAEKEGFSVYIKGNTLYFQPKISDTTTPFLIEWSSPDKDNAHPQSQVLDLGFQRSLTLAKDIIVYVNSYDPKTKKKISIKKTATMTKETKVKGEAQPVGDAQVYTFTKPSLTIQDAEKLAESRLRELTSHQVKMHCELPADNALQTENMIKVVGCASFSQMYYPDTITRNFSVDGGYTMRIEAKNHDPNSQPSMGDETQ